MGIGRTPEVILKSDERTVILELGTRGKFSAKTSAWDENKVLLERDHLDIKVKDGRWVLTEPRKAPPIRSSTTFATVGIISRSFAWSVVKVTSTNFAPLGNSI